MATIDDASSWLVIPLHLCIDLIGFVSSCQKPPEWNAIRVNYAGHLAGVVFGWLYYQLAMRQRLDADSDVERPGSRRKR
ncbi:hypothetical protein Tdes44962_MAKER05676 [Teratosphaeria destructans]|uniref:Uncharacterized protein n=1 Tax=Teratosphaeria destructans TaxID=418781 RepID=A0A9W7SJK9_9PEZI|nr:hypothetical protein Tdes44962_MAKER05676 [Teratosphaeria destructans]